MKILVALTYYRPHISGLTIYAERLARSLARRGHYVTVFTSQYDRGLPLRETIHGVHVVRVPVAFHVSKGVIMPSYGRMATEMVREHDVLNVHLPQFDAWGLALRGRLFHKPTILTYHCDLRLPPGLFNRVVDEVIHAANWVAVAGADKIVTNTQDYADNSRLLRPFGSKICAVPPPIVMPSPDPAAVAAFRAAHGMDGRPTVSLAARFAAEKGVETVVEALPILLQRFPTLRVLFAGPYKNVLGEEAYWARLSPLIAAVGEHWQFLGILPDQDMPAFLAASDCLLVPSLNSTESFGMIQAEAMLCGTPVIASDIPGVRQPVRMTGMGQIVPPRDALALADAVTRVLDDRERYTRPRKEIAAVFDVERTVDQYERMFEESQARSLRRILLPRSERPS